MKGDGYIDISCDRCSINIVLELVQVKKRGKILWSEETINEQLKNIEWTRKKDKYLCMVCSNL